MMQLCFHSWNYSEDNIVIPEAYLDTIEYILADNVNRPILSEKWYIIAIYLSENVLILEKK